MMQTRQKLLKDVELSLPTLAVAGLLLLLYLPLVWHWCDGWINKTISIEHEYYSHGLLGLPFATYLVWENRTRWQQLPDRTNSSGLGLMALGITFYLSGIADAVNLSFPILLAGLCLWLKGLEGLRFQAFPLLLVFLSTPTEIPYLIAPYTLPLQKFIASVAGFILLQLGIDVRVDQIYLFVNNRIVEVAPYCAGLKMLFTSLYVGLMLLYWTGNWTSRTRITLFFSGVILISVTANIIRNTVLTFFHGTGRDYAFDWLHEGWGGDLYSALMLLLLIPLLKMVEFLVKGKRELEPEM